MTSKRIFAILVIAILLFVAVPALSQESTPADQNAEALKQLDEQRRDAQLKALQDKQQRILNQLAAAGQRSDEQTQALRDDLAKANATISMLLAEQSKAEARRIAAEQAQQQRAVAAEKQRVDSDQKFRRNLWIAGGIFAACFVTFFVICLVRIGSREVEDQPKSLELKPGATDAEVAEFLKSRSLSGVTYLQPLTKEKVPVMVEGYVEFDLTRQELVYSFGNHKANAKNRIPVAVKAYQDKSAPFGAIQ